MTITSVGHQHYAPAPDQRSSRGNHVSTTAIDASLSTAVETADHGTNSKNTEAAPRHHDDPKGVLGLLQSGHFKGVAAVRLGINFHEQLSGLNQAPARTRLGAAARSLHEQVSGALEVYPQGASEEQVQLVTEARETFSDAIHTAMAGFKHGETGRDGTLTGMQAAFDDLMLSLEAAFAAAEGESGTLIAATDAADETLQATIEGVVEEASAEVLDAVPAGTVEYLATIGQLFNSWMEDRQSEMGAISTIPEFTAPKGNGIAFEKFMAIYRDLAGVEMSDDVSVAPEAGVDAMAEEGVDLEV
jgi:hypothetical protein